MAFNNADTEVLRLIRLEDANGLQSELQQKGFTLPPKIFATSKEALSYIKSFSLKTIFGTGSSLCCFFHDDKNPSASVYQANSGDWLYKCHSSTCKMSGKATNILGLVKGLQENGKAFPFLLKAFNVSVEAKDNTLDFFIANTKALCKFKALAPTAFSLFDINVLQGIYNCAAHCFQQVNCNGWSSVTLSMSNQQLANQCHRKNLKVSPLLALFAFLGILHRVPSYELDNKRYDALMQYRITQKAIGQPWARPINYIKLFLLTDKKLIEIEENAKRFKALGYSRSVFTYDMIYRKEGSFIAHDCFPCGDMDHADESSFQKIKKKAMLILDRELSLHDSIYLSRLKELLVNETGLTPKRVRLVLKPVMDSLCNEGYCRAKDGRFTIIKKINPKS